jgi:nucleoid DNA-binding protein
MTKSEMAIKIAEELGMSKMDVKHIVQHTLDTIIETLADEGRLELRNFGVFEIRKRKPRKARNPRTGEEVIVPESMVVSFKAGKKMEDRIYDQHNMPRSKSDNSNSDSNESEKNSNPFFA